jgi:bifunctional ADP-heptose synthase (sugar kinase/adenylyltransferase)
MSVGYLADSFDLINVRDLDLIAQARARCARLVVGVFTDEYAERVFGRRPIIPLSERMAVLREVRGIVEVVAHDDASADDVSAAIRFAAADAPQDLAEEAVWLTPARRSASVVLRNVLAIEDQEAVA